MPVTIKTPACPVVVSPPAFGSKGAWAITGSSPDLVAEFRDESGKLLGFALTGDGTKRKLQLQKELPPIIA